MIAREGEDRSSDTTRATERRSESTRRSAEETPIRRVRAHEVLGSRGILQIEHEGEVYTLRLTRNNRLILTK